MLRTRPRFIVSGGVIGIDWNIAPFSGMAGERGRRDVVGN